MDCIICGRDAGFNRVVVDSFRNEEVGGLCRECERREFGLSLLRGRYREREGCILCARDGHYAIPRGEPVARRTPDGDVVSDITFDVTGETECLCEEHLAAIASQADPASERPMSFSEFF